MYPYGMINGYLRRILSRPRGEETIVWHFAANGNYNAKLGYHKGMEKCTSSNSVGTSSQMHGKGTTWKSVWGLNCLPKIKHFIWKACHDVAPTNEALARRRHSRSMGCSKCDEHSETIEHFVFFCPHSPSEIGFGSFAKWWLAMVDMVDKGDTTFDLNLLATTIRGIWKIRNRIVFEGEKGDPIKEWLSIEKQYMEYRKGTKKTCCYCSRAVIRNSNTGMETTRNWNHQGKM